MEVARERVRRRLVESPMMNMVDAIRSMDAAVFAALIGFSLSLLFLRRPLENVTGGYLDPLLGGGVKEVVPYFALVLILMVRPAGLFGRKKVDRV